MQALFVTVAMVGLFYFLFAKRRFDFFSVAFVSACVYFLPGFFGHVNDFVYEDGETVTVDAALIPETYVVFAVVLVAILLAGMVFDYTAKGRGVEATLRGAENAAVWAVALALVGFVMSGATIGGTLLSAEKSYLVENLNRWYFLWVIGASLGAVLSFEQRRWGLFSASMILLLADMYIGFRYSFAISIIAVFTLWLAGKGRQRFMLRSWRIALVIGMFTLFVLVYKRLYVQVKLGSWDSVADRLSSGQIYTSSVTNSEPFITQAILNKVLANHFYVGMEHFFSSVELIVPFSRILGGSATKFNDLFQPALFPQAEAGMANNIWAEMLSSGGWPLFALFVIFFVSLLALGSYLLRVRDPLVAGGGTLVFSYWAFYVHRNDLVFQISVEKQILFLWAVCVLFSMVSYGLANYLKGRTSGKPPERGRFADDREG